MIYHIINIINIYKKESYLIIQKNTIPANKFNLIEFIIIISPINCFSLCIINISRLKIIEKRRPTYVIIDKAITNLLVSNFDFF